MPQANKTLMFLSAVMLINAISYGVIIPLLYPYAARFGINAQGLSFLFASFSIAQFISTPIIGRLSDRWGRKPLLVFCLFGTAASQVLFALAGSAWVLFVARILDGLTGGNNSVAQAVITDTTKQEERAKYFGILGAAFGFGFLIGSAIGGLLSGISLTAPYWFSAFLAFIGAAFGFFFLPETLDKTHIERKALVKPHNLITALTSPSVGLLLIITFIVSVGQNAWILGFQSFTVDVLKLSARTIGLIFSLVGLVGIVMQGIGVKWIIKVLGGMKRSLQVSLLLSGLNLMLISLVSTVTPFIIIVLLSGVFGAAILPVLSALITQNTKAEDQGGILGISQGYTSLGQIIGPLLAGVVIGRSMAHVFILAGGLMVVSFFASLACGKRCEQRVDL